MKALRHLRGLGALLFLVPMAALASTAKLQLDHAPIDLHDKQSLQRGAAIFVNHCLNCHSANVMRYGRLEDIGLEEDQIRDYLLFAGEKVGETMTVAVDPKVSKAAFGVVPPDLSLIGRSRSHDWLFTYLRSFYRDPESKTGWNNLIFPNVAMPHVLWQYQGDQVLQVTQRRDENTGDVITTRRIVRGSPGTLTPIEYDRYVADLVNYLAFMAEPAQASRKLWGILVLFFLAGFFVLTLMLKREFWKDVK
jgi:ubiquinol-cytochrome c reductase cytochrome c1 subunit